MRRRFFAVSALSATASISFGAFLATFPILDTAESGGQFPTRTQTASTFDLMRQVHESAAKRSILGSQTSADTTELTAHNEAEQAEETRATEGTPEHYVTASVPHHTVDGVPTVPFFSQFNDITSPRWKKVSCGIASLAMLVEFHKPGSLSSLDTLLQEGIDANAYLDDAGWTYAGLIAVSKKYGLSGETHDYGGLSMTVAFAEFEKALTRGPVMASVHYTFEPDNPIPHLVIINGIRDGMVYYNDPSDEAGGNAITVEKFQNSWKKRYIEFYAAS